MVPKETSGSLAALSPLPPPPQQLLIWTQPSSLLVKAQLPGHMPSRAVSRWRRCSRPGCPARRLKSGQSGDLRKATGGRASCGKGPEGGGSLLPGSAGLSARPGLCRGHSREATLGAPVGGSVAREDRRPAGSESSHGAGSDGPPPRPSPAASTRSSARLTDLQVSRYLLVTCLA